MVRLNNSSALAADCRLTRLSGGQPPQGGPTNDWQLQTVRTIVARSQAE
jgi:hypothetical protein